MGPRVKYTGIIRDDAGNVYPSVIVFVYLSGTTTVATIYDAVDAVSPAGNITTNTSGQYTFYVDLFDYDYTQRFKIYMPASINTSQRTVTYDSAWSSDIVEGAYAVSADKTVSTYVRVPKGVTFAVATGKTLTFSGGFEAGLYQVFSGVGTVTFSTIIPEQVYPEWWGADTSETDNQSYFQAALNSGVNKVFVSDGTWIVGNTTGNTVSYRSANHYYCLSIPSNICLEFSPYATLKLKDAANAHLFTNSDHTTGNSNINIIGGIHDLNQANQTDPATGEQSGGLFYNVTNLRIENIKHTNVREYALRVTGITKGTFRDLWCTDSDGSGYAFGLDETGHAMTGCHFDNIKAESCAGGFVGAIGNGFIFHGNYCTMGTIYSDTCAYGVKIQDTSSYCNIEQIISVGTTADHGVKLQGTDASNRVNHVNIGRIISKSNYYAGFMFEHASDITIGSINSELDSTEGTSYSAISLGEGTRININLITCNSSGNGGVRGEDDLSYLSIGQLIVRNAGQVGTAANFTLLSDYVNIGSITTIDDQTGSETVTRGVNITSDCGGCLIGQIIAQGSFTEFAVATDPAAVCQIGQQLVTTTLYGVPSGGTTGQVLTKTSNTDYDTEWATP